MQPTQRVGVHKDGSPYSEAECEQIIAKLEELLDGELDAAKTQEVNEMVNNCEYCFEQYNLERSLRSLVKNGFKNVMASANLVRNIKETIRRSRAPEETPES
jgi:anti-sigma factor (TIGR02949 family)